MDADLPMDIRNYRKIAAVYHDGRSIAELPGARGNESSYLRIKNNGERF
jgi:hypothetical protein